MNHAPTQKESFVNRRSLFLAASFTVATSVLFAISAFAASGDVDTTFNSSAFGSMPGSVYVMTPQPDGKMLIGGQFTDTNGHATSGIARLNADGTTDTTFTPPDFYNGSGIGATIYAITVQPDGKILVGGFILGAGDTGPGIRRLNADGSLDTTFAVQLLSPVTENVTIFDIGLQSDGKIILAGAFGFEFDNNKRNLQRLLPTGEFDSSFTGPSIFGIAIKDIEVLADDKIIAVGGDIQTTPSYSQKFNANGSIDTSFTPVVGNGPIEAVKVLPNGKVMVGGRFSVLNGVGSGRVARINADGSVDVTFNSGNAGANTVIYDIAVRSDGKIVVGGEFANYNAVTRQRLAQLNVDGTLDTSFLSNPVFVNSVVNDVEIQADGKVIAGLSLPVPVDLNQLIRTNVDGSTDMSYVVRANRSGSVREVLQQPDGKVLVCGEFSAVNGATRKSIARLNANGSLDTAFVPFNSGLSVSPNMNAIAVQNDGKILAGTFATFLAIVNRLNADGTVDGTFDASNTGALTGYALDIVVLPNGQILVGGFLSVSGNSRNLVRLNANGTIDGTFSTFQPDSGVNKIVVLPSGKILIAGSFSTVAGAIRGKIARLNSDGTLDTTFNAPGGASGGTVYDLDVQADGKIVLGGDFTALNGNGSIQRLGRLNSDGSLDSSYIQSVNGTVFALKIQSDGKLLIGGAMNAVSGVPRNGIARLNPNGTIDFSVVTKANTTVLDINLQTDGKILLGGAFTKVNGRSAVRVARLQNSIAPNRTPFDYDGDGKADVSMFRAATNQWYILRSSDFGVTQTTFAIAGDVPAPADFDGDGKTDVAIFRPSNGNWWSLSSINGQQINFPFGTAGDIPLPSDFDGDGRSDYVVFRPSTNQWLMASSANGAQSNKAFGLAGDKPVIGDFDGDGKTDVAVYRPSDGNWWWWSSFDNVQRATRWGIASDIPAPADFDGDGKTDFAVFRPSTGVWYIYNSATQTSTIGPFGLTGDKPVPADFDGDGKADIAVYRPSDGIWYLLRTTSGFTGFRFGISTDVPTQNAFLQ